MKSRRKLRVMLLFAVLAGMVVMSLSAEAAVRLNKKSATIRVGKTVQLKVTGTKKKVVWSTSDKKIASVSKKGLVKGLREGEATITAKVNDQKLNCKITVEPVEVELNNKGDLYIGGATEEDQSIDLKTFVEVKPAKTKLVWKSSDTKVATVKNGLVTAVANGVARITVWAAKASSASDSAVIHVVGMPEETEKKVVLTKQNLDKYFEKVEVKSFEKYEYVGGGDGQTGEAGEIEYDANCAYWYLLKPEYTARLNQDKSYVKISLRFGVYLYSYECRPAEKVLNLTGQVSRVRTAFETLTNFDYIKFASGTTESGGYRSETSVSENVDGQTRYGQLYYMYDPYDDPQDLKLVDAPGNGIVLSVEGELYFD